MVAMTNLYVPVGPHIPYPRPKFQYCIGAVNNWNPRARVPFSKVGGILSNVQDVIDHWAHLETFPDAKGQYVVLERQQPAWVEYTP